MKRYVLALFVIAALAAGASAWYRMSILERPLEWQGWVEGDYLFLGADDGGRLSELNVKEGEAVTQGATLFSVESDLQQADLIAAKAALAEAQARLDRLEAAQQRPEEIAVLEAQQARAKAAIEQSQPELDRAQELLKRGFAPHARVEQATAALERDKALLVEIERQISVAKLKSRQEDIAVAQTVVEQARSRLASAETRRLQRSVRAPAGGIVQEIFYRQGEVVPAGRPVLSLLPPRNLKVRFFVPQSQFPKLKAGSQIAVSCDGCAGGMKAEVFFLSTQAEFTPPVIFSREEREKLVFRIEARPFQPELLHVGQPVSVRPLDAAFAQDRDKGRNGGG